MCIRDRPYSPELLKVFQKYKSEDKNSITMIGLTRFIEDLGLELEDPVTLCLAELMECSSLQEDISMDTFIQSWHDRLCENFNDMKLHVKELEKKLRTDVSYFESIYNYTFTLALEPQQKQLGLETSIAYWELLFSPAKPYAIKVPQERLQSWIQYLSGEVAKVHRDVWKMFLKFAVAFPDNEALKKGYSEDDAWPLVIDEYYEYLVARGDV